VTIGHAAGAQGTAEEVDRNLDGHAIALTVFSTVRRWGLLELPLFFLYLRSRRAALETLKQLSFIHSARWSLVTRIPYNGPPQPKRRLRFPHLYFESNFNGGWEEYIDAFSYVLKTGMFAFWGSSYGFPGALPAGPFKAYIRRNAISASHFYSAYPEGTATMILGALQLEPHVDDLREHAAQMSPEEFAAAWRKLITDQQACL
jgi:hypothetical protein